MNFLEQIDSSLEKSKTFPRFNFVDILTRMETSELKKIVAMVHKTTCFNNSRMDGSSLFNNIMKTQQIDEPTEPIFFFIFGESLNISYENDSNKYLITIPQENDKIYLYNVLLYIFMVHTTVGRPKFYNSLYNKISEFVNGR